MTEKACMNDQAVSLAQLLAADKNGNGVFDDAPNVVPDANGDGKVDATDLVACGVVSNIAEVDFTINPNPQDHQTKQDGSP